MHLEPSVKTGSAIHTTLVLQAAKTARVPGVMEAYTKFSESNWGRVRFHARRPKEAMARSCESEVLRRTGDTQTLEMPNHGTLVKKAIGTQWNLSRWTNLRIRPAQERVYMRWTGTVGRMWSPKPYGSITCLTWRYGIWCLPCWVWGLALVPSFLVISLLSLLECKCLFSVCHSLLEVSTLILVLQGLNS